MNKQKELPIGSCVGILGGGQLGRMLSLSASQLGLKTHIYDPEIDAPAKQVTNLSSTFKASKAFMDANADLIDVKYGIFCSTAFRLSIILSLNVFSFSIV